MPSPTARLTLADAVDHVRARSFTPSAPCRVGVELEWLTVADGDESARVEPAVLRGALPPSLPAGSAVTFEPGGQLEVSSLPFLSVDKAIAAAAADLAVARAGAARAGVRLVGLGADPRRLPHRVVHTARYAAMEGYFDREGPAGRQMMCNSAALQVNVGLGPTDADADRQWRVGSAVGATLAAAFANSPLAEGGPTGFRSSRMAWWWAMDPTRARPAPAAASIRGVDAWAAYVLDARVMLIRADADRFEVPAAPAPTFREWLAGGHPLGWPTQDDLDYHLTTLFPPMRAKGWWELRMIDALPDPWWRVPLAVAACLLLDPEAGLRARRAAEAAGVTGSWFDAARTGLATPALAASARACFAAAMATERWGPALADLVGAYAERWVERGRTPADDVLDAWGSRRGALSDPAGVVVTSWT